MAPFRCNELSSRILEWLLAYFKGGKLAGLVNVIGWKLIVSRLMAGCNIDKFAAASLQ
jgi:hypothetical protein